MRITQHLIGPALFVCVVAACGGTPGETTTGTSRIGVVATPVADGTPGTADDVVAAGTPTTLATGAPSTSAPTIPSADATTTIASGGAAATNAGGGTTVAPTSSVGTPRPTTTPAPVTTTRPTNPRTRVVDNGVIDINGAVRSDSGTSIPCGTTADARYTYWVAYDNGEVERYRTTMAGPSGGAQAHYSSARLFDLYGLQLAKIIGETNNPADTYVYCSIAG